MWTVSGPFDGDSGDISFAKPKLLKTNTKYTLGRKGTKLSINNKKISGEHATFEVGEFDAAGDPSKVPKLMLIGSKKIFKIKRGTEMIHFTIGTPAEIYSGDEISLITGFFVTARWEAVCCYPISNPAWNAACTSLGVNLAHNPRPEVTHHLTPSYIATASIATSLISSAQLVKPEWLQEVLNQNLEERFAPPLVSKFRPDMPQNLDPPHKHYGVWEPNEERLHIFKDYRFLCVGEKAREVPLDLRIMIERGDGSLESFDVHLGVDKFRKALTRGNAKTGKKLVLLGDTALLSAAVGNDVLREFVQQAKSYNLEFTSTDTLVQTVLDVNTSKLDSVEAATGSESQVPNTYPEEPSVVEEPFETRPSRPPPPRRLLRRLNFASREPSAAPEAPPAAPAELPRRPTRRLNRNTDMVTGLDDPSSILDSAPDLDAPSAPALPVVASTPRPKLKRRLKQGSVEPTPVEGTFEIQDSIREPPLKRFKALFEASDPDNFAQSQSQFDGDDGALGESGNQTGSQTQGDTQTGTFTRGSKNKVQPSLTVLREEEEETGPGSLDSLGSKGKKRRLDDDEDVEMENREDASQNHPAKRRATGNLQAVPGGSAAAAAPSAPPPSKAQPSSKPPSRVGQPPAPAAPSSKPKSSKSKSGADPGKPDTDAAFLKAIASTKRGKKHEDEFDREFNKLKISKPDLNDEEPEKDWAVLADFGDDTGLRGNFMTILQMDVFRERGVQQARTVADPRWQGLPNFKKFKKKDTRSERPKIDLFANDDGNTGLALDDWENGTSGARTQAGPKPKPRRATNALGSPEPSEPEVDDDEDATPPPRPTTKRVNSRKPSTASSRAGSVAASAVSKKTATRRGPKPVVIDEDEGGHEPLFLNTDDGDDDDDVIELDDDGETVRSVASFDSFNPSKAKAKVTNKRAMAPPKKMPGKRPVVRNDSDDDD